MVASAADRNLLFGILALQMDFISRDALIQAMHAWVLEKAKPLGQILVERGTLPGDLRECVEVMIDKHVQVHGNDPQQSLAAISSASSIPQDLQEIADPDVHASLARVAAAREEPTDSHATRSVSAGTASRGSRFRIIRPHARGGIGEVFVARDEELNREVALKEMQSRHAENPASRARFVLEAEITGGLEHPGIVPVYGLGRHADGRPFYAMRFIRGDSLMEAIEKYHKPGGKSPAGPARNLQLRNLLRRLIDVCNALQYAHDRGVLHRDLKPGNIMLGKYGETLVVDWGLAKAVGSRQSSQDGTKESGVRAAGSTLVEPPLRPASGSGSAETVAGSAIGTPAFMSPEQAAGRVDLLGPASDVYSLGATLYCLLTGQSPVKGPEAETLKKVQAGDFPLPRQIKREIVPSLEAICLKAMALRAQDRYAAPKDLADDIEQWLADEPVGAWPEPWTIKSARFMRKHRTLVTSAAAVLLVATIASILASALLAERNQALDRANGELDRQNEALDAANRELDAAIASLRTTNSQLELARKDAVEKRQQAEQEKQIARAVRTFLQSDLLRQAHPTEQANRVLQLGGNRFTTIENPTIKELLDRAAAELTPEQIDEKFPNQPLVQAEILETLGTTYEGVGKFAEAVTYLERARSLYDGTLGNAHSDTRRCMNSLASAYRAAGRLELAVPLLENTLKLTRAEQGPKDRETLAAMSNLAIAYQGAGKLDQALPLLQKVLDLAESTLGPENPDTLTCKNNLAVGYKDARKIDLALPIFTEILKLRRAMLGPDHPDTLTSINNLAAGHRAAGEVLQALPLFQDALERRRAKLGPKHPDTLSSMNNLAGAYHVAGKRDLALPLLEETLDLSKATLGPKHPDTLMTMNNLATAYLAAGKRDLAVQLYVDTLKLRRATLGSEHPVTLTSISNLADRYLEGGNADLAVPLYEELLKRRKANGADNPETIITTGSLAKAYLDAKQFDKALPLVRQYVAGERKQMGRDNPRFAGFLSAISQDLLKVRVFVDAEKLLRESLAIQEKKEPDLWSTFNTQSMLGAALLGQEKYADAEPLLFAGYEGMKQRGARIPQPVKNLRLQEAMGRLVDLFEATRKRDETKRKGSLTDAKAEAAHDVKLTAGKIAVVELQSKQFNMYLRLQDAKGKLLAENDVIDAASKNLNSRILFMPKDDGVFHIIATSFEQRGRGEYEIIIREYSAKKRD
jgi:serine/threonine protein kinase